MDAHPAPGAAKRMWGYIRAVLFMLRKGKRRLLLGLSLLMKRRKDSKGALARSVATLLSHHGHGHALRHGRGEYEFSCSGSPVDPRRSRSSAAYFPCLLGSEPAAAALQYRIGYDDCASAAAEAAPELEEQRDGVLMGELEAGEECGSTASPLVASAGAFSVRVSNFSSEDGGGGGEAAVDDEAEEFISRFYDQLRQQNQVAAIRSGPVYLQQDQSAAR